MKSRSRETGFRSVLFEMQTLVLSKKLLPRWTDAFNLYATTTYVVNFTNILQTAFAPISF